MANMPNSTRTSYTRASNESLRKAFQAIDEAFWSAIEAPFGGIDPRIESLSGCFECIEAYTESRRKEFDALLHDARFLCLPLPSRPPCEVTYSSDNQAGNQSTDHSDKPIVAAFRSKFAPMVFFFGALFGFFVEIVFSLLL